MVAGLGAMVAGTFLPWVRSGSTRRNSYSATGLLRRLLEVHGPTLLALRLWALLGVLSALVVVALLAGLPRTGAVVAIVVSLSTAGVAVATLRAPGRFGLGPEDVGPIVTLVADGCTCIGAMLLTVSRKLT